MSRLFGITVRVSYLLAATLALLGGSWLVIEIGQSVVSRGALDTAHGKVVLENVALVLIALVYVAPSVRVLGRMISRGELIPDTHLSERPVVTTLVLLTSAGGTTLISLAAWALLDRPPDSRGINIGWALTLAAMSYAFALLTGEFVLVGRTARPD